MNSRPRAGTARRRSPFARAFVDGRHAAAASLVACALAVAACQGPQPVPPEDRSGAPTKQELDAARADAERARGRVRDLEQRVKELEATARTAAPGTPSPSGPSAVAGAPAATGAPGTPAAEASPGGTGSSGSPCAACAADAEPVSVVDGEPLTRGAYKEFLHETFGAENVDLYVNTVLLEREAAHLGLSVTDDDVKEWVEQRVEDMLANPMYKGLDPETIRERFRAHARMGAVIERIVRKRRGTEEGLRREYEALHGTRLKARHILYAVDLPPGVPEEERKAKDAEAKAKAEAACAKLAKGADFGELARQESDDPGSAEKGGDLQTFGRYDMVPEFADVAFALPEGKISEPVRSEFGYHIIQVTKIMAPSKPFDEAMKEKLRGETDTRPVEQGEVAALINDLRSGAKIERR